MIGKEFTYKWINLWQTSAYANKIVITDVNKNITLRTKIFEKQNYHWVSKSNTLSWWRLFTFKFTIFWNTKAERYIWQQLLESIIVPESNPWATEWLYPLYWKNDNWTPIYCNACVYSTPQYDDIDPWNPTINWTFELFAPNPEYYSVTQKTNDWDYWRKGWFVMPFIIPFAMTKNLWEVIANNAWNFACPLRITVVWSIENPKITNITTGKFYWLNKTTTNLVIDNTWTTFIITDEWINAKADRMTGSEILRLNPWNNTLILTWDNFDRESSIDRDLFYNDTFI